MPTGCDCNVVICSVILWGHINFCRVTSCLRAQVPKDFFFFYLLPSLRRRKTENKCVALGCSDGEAASAMWLHGVTSKRTTVVRIRVLEIDDSDLEHLTFCVSPKRFVAGNKNSNKILEALRDEISHGCECWPVSDEDTIRFLPSVGIMWRPILFVIMVWMDIYRIHFQALLFFLTQLVSVYF